MIMLYLSYAAGDSRSYEVLENMQFYMGMYDIMRSGGMQINIAAYQTTPEEHGEGTFFFTDYGNNMYSIRDNMAYHGCLCKGVQTTLYIRGSEEANKYWDEKLK